MGIDPITNVVGSKTVSPPSQSQAVLEAQLGAGMILSGVRQPAAIIDLSEEARKASELLRQSQEVVTIVQSASSIRPVVDDKKERRWGWLSWRRCRTDSETPPLDSKESKEHIDVTV